MVTQDDQERILEAQVLITDGRIVAVLPEVSPPIPSRWLNAEGMVVIPGFVRAHTHLGRMLYRGRASGSCTDSRLTALDRLHDDDTAYASTLLGAAEYLLSGVTTVGEFGLDQGKQGTEQAVLDAGIRVGIGRRDVACDASLDPFEAMRFTLATHPEATPAMILKDATRGNAEAMGMGNEVGSLEPGKAGDLVVLDVRGHRGFAPPGTSPVDRVVRYAGRWSIRWVIVDGEVLVEDGRMPHLELDTLALKADAALEALWARSDEGTRS